MVEGVEPGVEASERLSMSRQDEETAGQRLQLRDRGEPVAERIGLRLAEAQGDVGGYPRQNLVARDHQPARLVDQARMFGAMAVSYHHAPVALPNAEDVAVAPPHEAYRHRAPETQERRGGKG